MLLLLGLSEKYTGVTILTTQLYFQSLPEIASLLIPCIFLVNLLHIPVLNNFQSSKLVSMLNSHDVSMLHCGHYNYDLVYTGLNVKYVLHFLVSTKYKANGKLKGN